MSKRPNTDTQQDKSRGQLESEPCPRCAGSGTHSWCQMWQDKCFGCAGTGYRLTKRGRAAADYLNSLRHIRADKVEAGDSIAYGRAFLRVLRVDMDEHRPLITLRLEGRNITVHEFPHSLVRRGWSREEKVDQFRRALAYQATLTKAGKPRKARQARESEARHVA